MAHNIVDHNARRPKVVRGIAKLTQPLGGKCARDGRVFGQNIVQTSLLPQSRAAGFVNGVMRLLAAEMRRKAHHDGLRDDQSLR